MIDRLLEGPEEVGAATRVIIMRCFAHIEILQATERSVQQMRELYNSFDWPADLFENALQEQTDKYATVSAQTDELLQQLQMREAYPTAEPAGQASTSQ